jgi:hypothetical protein
MRRLYPGIVTAFILLASAVPSHGDPTGRDVRVLLVGSHGRGATNWITRQSLLIENFLHFNGLPYDFFDISTDSLDQAVLDSYHGVILEGNAMRWDATEDECRLIADCMEAGNITALVALIDGEYTQLNGTIYGAMNVSVDGQDNSEHDIHLLPGAREIYDYSGDNGFVVCGGPGGMHVAVAGNSLGNWMYTSGTYGGSVTYGVEFALETWLENAFGADARVTLPVISLRLDDTETTCAPRNQAVIDFMDANKHRIRASGYLVTDASAYHGSDSLLKHDEQVISEWGSMSLHGKDHASVGAEGENQGYAVQCEETNAAVDLLRQDFARYKPIKACPSNSWNEATLHALCANGIYYHTADMSISDDYKALYKSLFDVESDLDRERMSNRFAAQLRYYPLAHTDETGEARVYSVDWAIAFSGTQSGNAVPSGLRAHGLDWWIPVMAGAHYYLSGNGGANNDPQGWMSTMNALMYAVDYNDYPWRRWVDNYDLEVNTERFDRSLRVNGISVVGDVITYDITADPPIRFLTLRAGKERHRVESVTINGNEYAYFGHDYVHLPEISGNAVIVVHLALWGGDEPHVTHIDPSAVIEDAQPNGGRLRLLLSGEFLVTAHVSGTNRIFGNAMTQVFPNNDEHVRMDASSHHEIDQIGLCVEPSIGYVEVAVGEWSAAETRYRTWTETAYPEPEGSGGPPTFREMHVDHLVGDLEPCSQYSVKVDGVAVDACFSSSSGEVDFSYCHPWSVRTFEVVLDSSSSAGVSGNGIRTEPEAPPGPSLRNCPNPFGSKTAIYYRLDGPSRVTLDIYSASGLLVSHVLDAHQPAGPHSCSWDGRDATGGLVGPGLYLCRIQTSQGAATRKIVLFR